MNNLKEYRKIISRRLAEQRNPNNGFGYNPNAPNQDNPEYRDGYGPSSVEVLVPAFLAAYQKKDPDKISLEYISINKIYPAKLEDSV